MTPRPLAVARLCRPMASDSMVPDGNVLAARFWGFRFRVEGSEFRVKD